MSQPAMINLVRVSTSLAANETDSTTGELATRHDEIALVDPTGDPCAIPTAPGEDNIDHDYAYITGARGHSLRGTLIRHSLNIDYITHEKSTHLERWKRERARVMLMPNLGRNTVFSWRAVEINGSTFRGGPTAKDLTGNYAMTATCGQYLRYWDTARRLFMPKTLSNRAQLALTPGGAGLLAFPTVVNRAKPTYPKSATLGSGATESGWIKGGAGAADISAALFTNGFGHPECPHSLAVAVAANVSSDRYLAITDQLNPAAGNYAGYTFVNGAAATVIVWLRGQFPDSASLQFGVAGGADIATRSLAGMRFDGWTPVAVSHVPTAWATNNPSVYLFLGSLTGIGCGFEVGPVMIMQTASGYSNLPAAPVWSPEITGGTASGVAQVATSATLALPWQGTLIASFYVPEDMSGTWKVASTFGLLGNTNVRLRAVIGASVESFNLSSVSPAVSVSTVNVPRGTYLVPGKINTVAIVWDGSAQKVYANGALVLTSVTAATTVPLSGSSSALMIGKDGGGYCCAPLAMLTVRIDEGAMTAVQVDQVHAALTDPYALAIARAAHGRTFRITRTPNMYRPTNGGTHVLGVIDLEQTDYDHFQADPFARELSIV